jgi:hypothetical protein
MELHEGKAGRSQWCRLTRRSSPLELLLVMGTRGSGRGKGKGQCAWGWRHVAVALVQIVSWGVMLVRAYAFLQGVDRGVEPHVLDYRDALEKSLKFFEAQRSGKLPPTQRVTWRGDSGMSDGLAQDVRQPTPHLPESRNSGFKGFSTSNHPCAFRVLLQIDLTGGYYDAGDNVKYGLPMAFTVTMLSWNVIQYRHHLQRAGELAHALEAIKWGTDYFIKAHPEPDVLWGEVWHRPFSHLLLPITLSCFQVTGHNLSEGSLSCLIVLRFPQILLRLL